MVENMEEVVTDMLIGSTGSRIKEVTRILNEAGVRTRDDLKYFDWKSLEELGVLSKMEINKIMRFVQQNFPEEYQEHKKKRNKEIALQRETDLLNFKIETETLFQYEKLKLTNDKDEKINDGYVMPEKESIPSSDYSGVYGIVSYLLSIFSSSETIQGPEKCIDKAVAEIFNDSTRVEFIIDVLRREGVRLTYDLKYFDEELLESLGGLEESEIKKILGFIKEKCPRIYELKITKKSLVQDLLKYKNEANILKQPSFIARIISLLKPGSEGTEV